MLAIQHTLQHGELPVLWDVRELDLSATLLHYEDSLRSLIARWRPEMSSEKRAFIVTGEVCREFEAFLGRLNLPWSWAVFETSEAALDWLQD